MAWWHSFGVGRRPPLHIARTEGSGPDVLLLHGIASSSVTFENLFPLLTPRHRVWAMDLLGFGESPSPLSARFTLDEHVDAVRTSVDRTPIRKPFTLVGHSLGALISLRFAARFPNYVRHVVVVAPPVYLPGDLVTDPVKKLRMDVYYRLWDFLRNNPSFTTAASKALSKLVPIEGALEVNDRNWRAFSQSLLQCIETQSILTDVAQVKAPIDLVYGTADPFVRPSGIDLLERVRGVATTRVEGQDHVIRPKLAQAVARVIDDPSPPTAPIRLVDHIR